MLNLILFGPPGSGKGTQAEKLKTKYNLVHISTGEVIRAEIESGSELGLLAASQMQGGALAADELVCGIIDRFIASHTQADGAIFDGFPRTMTQANEFDRMLALRNAEVTLLIALQVTDCEVIRRIKTRAHSSGRADDQDIKIISHRLEVYKKQTFEVTNHYQSMGKVHTVDGSGSIDETFDKISSIIDSVTR